ncbi:GNAT acetyltransferase 2 [Ordospora pajunii]|uniref:GNAT acetyltransferase 2 n=1 Tax=Ordospora pajunii TaxID=3039483 RepID=UPI0029527FA9|nr:GNAT acetyltransferase 2 [Ordospora pajunii]KAH9411517.1 GNAT acetyltransferase 2 [Ordospora pajunii]
MTFVRDGRIQSFFEMNSKRNHRSFVVVMGEGGKNKLGHIHKALQDNSFGTVGAIVWCHKSDVVKKMNKEAELMKKQKNNYTTEDCDDDVFSFIRSNEIDFVEYKESERILGRTVDMLILQDFEALSPNLIATSMETVRGGGAIVLLLDSATSIETLVSRRTDGHLEIGIAEEFKPRYNRRLFKLLMSSNFVLFVDERLNVLDISRTNLKAPYCGDSNQDPVGVACIDEDHTLKRLSKTNDQLEVIKTIFEVLESCNDRTIVSITASRGRGKSAALGISIAHAINTGVMHILVASPVIENVKTVFEFAVSGLEALGYTKYVDFKIIYQFRGNRRLAYKIQITKTKKQVVEYFNPLDDLKKYPDMMVIDEAAAIPLTSLMRLVNPNLVVMATTISGYEGTGRAFSIKLTEFLRKSSIESNTFIYKEITMKESIRYGAEDPVERWLYKALLLDVSAPKIEGCPSPSECKLFHVDRDALLSGKASTEKFLSNAFSLFVSSHYRNSPNDLQILADSPRHEMFTLVTPVRDDGKELPGVMCSIQIAFEGRCKRTNHLREGNLIPWVVSEEYLDPLFLESYGIRIVRMAVHPEYARMGYGTMALKLLIDSICKSAQNELCRDVKSRPDDMNGQPVMRIQNEVEGKVLLHGMDEVVLPYVEWIGASFGLTEDLHRFWSRNGFLPICIKQMITQETGEHSSIFIRPLDATENASIALYNEMFVLRFIRLLSGSFRYFTPTLSLSLIGMDAKEHDAKEPMLLFCENDVMRMKQVAIRKADISIAIDLIPEVSKLYFRGHLKQELSILRKSVLLMVGCQNRSINETALYLTLKPFQVSNILAKVLEALIDGIEKHTYTANIEYKER